MGCYLNGCVHYICFFRAIARRAPITTPAANTMVDMTKEVEYASELTLLEWSECSASTTSTGSGFLQMGGGAGPFL